MALDGDSHKYKAIRQEESGESHANNDRDDGEPSDIQNSQHDEAQRLLAEQANLGQNFTLRGVLVGLAIGIIICFSNTYFGLQTGWVSGMAMPSALIGFAFFKSVAKYIDYPFTPVENVLVTTVAGAVGTMPLGCGFVGVMPALNFLLTAEENGPLVLSTGKLIIWAIGICFFGVVFAVPLRKEVIIREKLKFPSGTATALVIGVLHGDGSATGSAKNQDCLEVFKRRTRDDQRSSSVSGQAPTASSDLGPLVVSHPLAELEDQQRDPRSDWKAKIKLLLQAFAVSAIYVSRRSPESSMQEPNLIDSRPILHTPVAEAPDLWAPPSFQLAVDAEPVPGVRWAR